MLPDTKADLKALLESNERSATAGGWLLGVTIFCLIGTITVSVVLIFVPMTLSTGESA